MYHFRIFLLALAVLLASPALLRADVLIADLGLAQDTTHTFTVPPGTHTVELRNVVPDAEYRVSFEVTAIPVETLEWPRSEVEAVKETLSACPEIATPLDELEDAVNAKDEKKIQSAVSDLQAALSSTSCGDRALVRLAHQAIRSTIYPIPNSQTLRRGEKLTAKISRQSGATEKKWTFVFTTGARGQWHTSYGFTLIPNGDEEFFLDQDDDKFIVTRKAEREDLDFATGVFFTWMPRKKLLRNLNLGPTAGLGFDLDNPVVFAGVAATWNQNLSLVLGAVAHEERRLGGQYEVGDELMENLESDQLHETTYAPAAFFGVTFRFGSNPFNSSGNDEGDDSD